jgi:hypothetical protein
MNIETKIGDLVRVCVNKPPKQHKDHYMPAYATNGIYRVTSIFPDMSCEGKLCLPGGASRTFNSWIRVK